MPKITIQAARRKKKDLDARDPGAIPPRLRGEFFTDSYAQIFEDAGKELYQDIISELVGGSTMGPEGSAIEVKGKLPELFEAAVTRLTETLKHKKGVDGLKDNAQFFAPWIKAVVDDVRTTGMKEIMKSLESLARDHSVKVVDEGLLEQPIPDVAPAPDALEADEPVPEDMALPEAIEEVPEIPDLSAEDVEGMLKGDEVPEAPAPAPATVSPTPPAPAGAAPGTPPGAMVPAPQPAAAATTMKDLRRQLVKRRQQRQVVAEPTKDDLLHAASRSLASLENDDA